MSGAVLSLGYRNRLAQTRTPWDDQVVMRVLNDVRKCGDKEFPLKLEDLFNRIEIHNVTFSVGSDV